MWEDGTHDRAHDFNGVPLAHPGHVHPQAHLSSDNGAYLVGHVGARVDAALGEFWQCNLEAFLNLLQHLLIRLAADKRDAQAFGAKTTRSADAVKVRVGIARQIIVDGEIDPFDVNATPKDIRRHADALVELLKLLVPFDTALRISSVRTTTLDHTYRSS